MSPIRLNQTQFKPTIWHFWTLYFWEIHWYMFYLSLFFHIKKFKMSESLSFLDLDSLDLCWLLVSLPLLDDYLLSSCFFSWSFLDSWGNHQKTNNASQALSTEVDLLKNLKPLKLVANSLLGSLLERSEVIN